MTDRIKVEPCLYPNSGFPPPQAPSSERKVYSAISGALPPGWFAWHSLKLRNAAGQFAEGEFVIAEPSLGILMKAVGRKLVTRTNFKRIWSQPPISAALRIQGFPRPKRADLHGSAF
jgi:hypothetical protein